jgi:hypothetical protein
MAVPSGSQLREPLDRTLLEVTATDDWLRLVDLYMGPNH